MCQFVSPFMDADSPFSNGHISEGSHSSRLGFLVQQQSSYDRTAERHSGITAERVEEGWMNVFLFFLSLLFFPFVGTEDEK